MPPGWSRPEFEEIAAQVARACGLRPPDASSRTESTILRQARAEAVSLRGYVQLLGRDPAVLETLCAELTVGETYFLRDAGQFTLIRERILPSIARRKTGSEPIRIWSAGCASGEEAYSLAIVAHELGLAPRAHILATDLARDRLERARAGRYGSWSFRDVPSELMRRYFRRVGRQYELDPAVRELVDFQYLNLAEDEYPSISTNVWGMDLILCRNVLIYLESGTVTRVARRLVASLAADGWLLLGATDPIIGQIASCAVTVTEAGLAYRPAGRGVADNVAEGEVSAPVTADIPELPDSTGMTERRVPRRTSAGGTRAPARRGVASPVAASVGAGSGAAAAAEQVRVLANQGRLSAAEQVCAAALEQRRDDAELLYLQSVLLSESGQLPAAVRAARQALYVEPQLVVAHLALGSALVRLHDVAGARRAFANAERLLAGMKADEVVPAAGGETAGRLLEIARMQLRLTTALAS